MSPETTTFKMKFTHVPMLRIICVNSAIKEPISVHAIERETSVSNTSTADTQQGVRQGPPLLFGLIKYILEIVAIAVDCYRC